MSIMLYRLGLTIARRRGLFIGVWMVVLTGIVGASVALGDNYDDTFTVPGTQSQQGQDLLLDRFNQSGTSAQILFTAASGKITDSANASAVKRLAHRVDEVEHVSMSNPLAADDPVISPDGRSTLGQALFAQQLPSERTLDGVQVAGASGSGSPVTTDVGGDAYKSTADESKLPELLGLMVAFLILCITFGSLITAGMPILTALIGVGVTLSAVVVTSQFVTVSSTSPTLAEMLGLAVGVDYALFTLSRYRRQLGDGVPPGEAMGRALATAGSAVVFAGATVVIALTGLTVAGIPVLTVMGLAAAVAVTVAVLVALTLLPAIALLFGSRLRPRARRRGLPGRRHRPANRTRGGVSTRWVTLVSRHPVLTIGTVVAALLVVAVPATSLELALPDNSTAPEASPERQTYDAITKALGEGYNAPLTLTAGVITSSDPVSTVDKLAKAVGNVNGVVAVTQATPNEGGDTALIQAIPKAGQTAESTATLVAQLRERSPGWENQYDVDEILVTGPTAINIDVSDRLTEALLPFACIVIGLSLLLLMVVFRSVAVPVKATLGYLLSVGAALGAVVAVFQWGWLDAWAPGLSEGPIVSFLPIFLMGVLFGLAMDYEMFLVSAMREDFVSTRDPRTAVVNGFRASSVVVTAAALIMVSVFVAFIPNGSSTIKPIAFGLAVGVFVDAFLVRMTLVPAILVLLGRHAWWLPSWLERRLPSVDVEGAAMHRRVEYQRWDEAHGPAAVRATDLVVSAAADALAITVAPGQVATIDVPSDVDPVELGLVLVGRRRPIAGELVIDGLLLPEQASAVQQTTAFIEVGRPGDEVQSLEEQIESRAQVTVRSRRHRHALVQTAKALVERLGETVVGASTPPTVARTAQAAALETALAVAGGARLVVVAPLDATDPDLAAIGARLAEALSGEDVTVALIAGTPSPSLHLRQPVRDRGETAAEETSVEETRS
ncbi:MAG: family transporter [Nocardioidaceae bacterium]|jgi:RND superfamily putative drug exporter|nr:family transporter [Nocardioidaceae bacterium]